MPVGTPVDVCVWPIAETAATGRRVRLLGYCCHQRDMRRRDLRMLRCRYHETKRLSDPPDDAWQTCTGMGVRSLAVACGGAQHDPGQSWAGAGGRDKAIVRHRAQLESAAREVAPCTGPEVGNDCIDGLRLICPRRSSQACCDGTTKVPGLTENTVPDFGTHRSATIGGTEKRYRPDHRDDRLEMTKAP